MKKTEQKKIEPILEAEVITLLGRESEGRDAETYKAEILDPKDRTITGYVKLTRDPRKVIAEMAASQVGRALGLSIPRPYLAILDTADLDEGFQSQFANQGPMLCFASKQAGSNSYSLERAFRGIPSAAMRSITKQFDMPSTVAFDELIANTDRNLGNLIYSPDTQKVWMIDHGRALTGEYWNLWGLDDPAKAVANTIADERCTSWDEGLRRTVITRAQDLVSACAELCLDDLDKEGHYAKIDSETDRLLIAGFLKERIQHTVPLLCQRLQMGALPLQQPRHS